MNPSIPGLSITELPESLAQEETERHLPSTGRIFKAPGVDIISFTFSPGQVLGDHHAPYPITVHCLEGEVDFIIGDDTIRMKEGTLLHLEEGITHHVQATADAIAPATILVSLLTGGREAQQ